MTAKAADNRSKWPEWLWRYAPPAIWIGIILFLSSPQGSMTETSRFIRPLLEFLFPSAPEETIVLFHGYIRKLAHFTEYGILGALAVRAFLRSVAPFLKNHSIVAAMLLVLLIASVDEFNQSFEVSRTGTPRDVLIDAFGGICGSVFCWLLLRKWRSESVSR
jgi:VanZ family protein